MERNVKHNDSVPEDLVQIQAYLRWERNGKQMYSPEKEKVSQPFYLYKHIFKDNFLDIFFNLHLLCYCGIHRYNFPPIFI